MSTELLTSPVSETGVAEMVEDSPSTEIVRAKQTPEGRPHHSCGYGPCTVYDCGCDGFRGTSYICEYCKHPYGNHS
jgi:hypothetical protein